jgi:hypothetical protein
MYRIGVRRSGDALVPLNPQDLEILHEMKENVVHLARITRRRNRKAHNLYFKVIEVATKHWPQDRDPRPEGNEEKLRAWLQCKAGHCEQHMFPPEYQNSVVSLIQSTRNNKQFCFIDPGINDDGEPVIVVSIPYSVDEDTVDEDQFRPVREKVFGIVESVLECSIETLIDYKDTAGNN